MATTVSAAERGPATPQARPSKRRRGGTGSARLYVASTPYHVLLALAHAQRQAARCGLFLYGNFPAAAELAAALAAAATPAPELVVEAYCLRYGDRAAKRAALRVLRRFLGTMNPAGVVVFNDHNDISQLALGWAARRGRARSCIEDGSSFYTQWTVATHRRRLRQLRKRLTTAPGWTALTVPGTHPLLQRVEVRRPDWVRPELAGRVVALDLDLIGSPAVARLAQHLWLCLSGTKSVPPRPEVLLAPAFASALDWRRIAMQHAHSGARVAFKYHPRETAADPCGLAAFGTELPRGLPLEIIHVLWGGSAAKVVSDAGSTVLLSARLDDPGAQLIGYYDEAPPSYLGAYSGAGIVLRAAPPEPPA